MPLYLTDETNEDTVVRANQSGFIKAFKLYPAGATTNSEAGMSAIQSLYLIFETMQTHRVPLDVHVAFTHKDAAIFASVAVCF